MLTTIGPQDECAAFCTRACEEVTDSIFTHNKRLQYTVRVSEANPGLASEIESQIGETRALTSVAKATFDKTGDVKDVVVEKVPPGETSVPAGTRGGTQDGVHRVNLAAAHFDHVEIGLAHEDREPYPDAVSTSPMIRRGLSAPEPESAAFMSQLRAALHSNEPPPFSRR